MEGSVGVVPRVGAGTVSAKSNPSDLLYSTLCTGTLFACIGFRSARPPYVLRCLLVLRRLAYGSCCTPKSKAKLDLLSTLCTWNLASLTCFGVRQNKGLQRQTLLLRRRLEVSPAAKSKPKNSPLQYNLYQEDGYVSLISPHARGTAWCDPVLG